MIRISGIFFDGRTARARTVELASDGRDIRVTDTDGALLLDLPDIGSACSVSPRLGDTDRVITFADGQRFETDDADGVQALEQAAGLNRPFLVVDFLEARWKAVCACLACLVAVVYLGTAHGIPFLAREVAFRLPPGVVQDLGTDALAILDKRFLTPTEIPDSRRSEIQAMFRALARDLKADVPLTLVFRKSKALGANALALPSGTIIMTDGLVDLSEDDRELAAILVHEIAHITRRHSLRSVIQNTGVFLLISMLVGDVASVTSLASGIPVLLVESGYSRKFETEADEAVGRYAVAARQDIQPFIDILTRLSEKQPGPEGLSFISSHPDTPARIARLRAFVERTDH